MKYIFYFDRIRINSFFPAKILKQIIKVSEIQNHCRTIVIGKPYKTAQKHGYKGRIELFQATDEAIKLLQGYDLGEHGISRLEIARDLVCNNSLVANKYRDIFQNNHYLKWGKSNFSIGDTTYLGKKEGIHRNIYVACYKPPREKLVSNPVVHVEFVLLRKLNISKKLGIETVYDIGKAEDHFSALFKKSIVRARVNHSRFKKHFPNKEIRNVNELVEFVSDQKQRIRERKLKHAVMYNFVCDKRMHKIFKIKKRFEFTKEEKLILNQGVSYWCTRGE